MNNERRTPFDASTPTLLLVSLAGVLVVVVAIVAIGQTSATAALFAGIVVALAGTAIVIMTMGRQLDDDDGYGPRDAAQRNRSERAS